MLSKKVPEPINLSIDQNWRENPNAKSFKLEKYD